MLRRIALGLALTALLPVVAATGAQAQAEAALVGATQVTAGGYHSCALLGNGQVKCWGSNYDGEAGNGTRSIGTMPVTTVLAPAGAGPLTGVTQVEVGFYHSCALLNTGQVRCWGYNGDDQVGNGSPNPQISRAKVVSNPAGNGPLTGVTQIALGERHTCARLNNGQVRCWGENTVGEIGDGTSGNTRPRARIVKNAAGTGPLGGVTQIDAGNSATCARLGNGQARCWGRNVDGMLGDGTTTPSSLPVAVLSPAGGAQQGITQIAIDENHACALLNSGQARCWGLNASGQIGDGTTTRRLRPRTVLNTTGSGPLTGVTQVDAGFDSSCARLGNGQARCWGRGDRGQLGWDSTSGNLLARVVVNPSASGPLMNVRQVRVGSDHACALLNTGQVRCWGRNDNGEVGDGTSGTDRDRPRVVVV